METFLQSVYYESGGYSTCDGMSKLDSRLQELEVRLHYVRIHLNYYFLWDTGSEANVAVCWYCQGLGEANRIFYLSVPHEVVPDVSKCLSRDAQSKSGWTRLIVEKPFGRDSESSAMLAGSLLNHLDESQIYRSLSNLTFPCIESIADFTSVVSAYTLCIAGLIITWERSSSRTLLFCVSPTWSLSLCGAEPTSKVSRLVCAPSSRKIWDGLSRNLTPPTQNWKQLADLQKPYLLFILLQFCTPV